MHLYIYVHILYTHTYYIHWDSMLLQYWVAAEEPEPLSLKTESRMRRCPHIASPSTYAGCNFLCHWHEVSVFVIYCSTMTFQQSLDTLVHTSG